MNPDLVVINHLGALGTGWYGIKTAVVGMAVVFVALVMLIGIIKLIGIFSGTKEKPAPALAVQQAAPAAAAQPGRTEAEQAGSRDQAGSNDQAEGAIDPQLLAAITAAVYAMLEEEKKPCGMIEKQGAFAGNAWAQKGREALMAKRLTV
ncbi:MAG: OadG family protein [Clostridiales bacterium]